MRLMPSLFLLLSSVACTADFAPEMDGTARSRAQGAGPFASLREAGATPHIDGPPRGVELADWHEDFEVGSGDLVVFATDVELLSGSTGQGTAFEMGTVARVEGSHEDWFKVDTYGEVKRSGWVLAETGWEILPQPELPRRELNKVGYAETWGDLFHGEAAPADVAQGYLNDCFLVAGMAAVSYAVPDIIEERIEEDDGMYTFSRYTLAANTRSGRRSLERATFDGWLPAVDDHLRYALRNKDQKSYTIDELNSGSHPMWPAIVEKGWAALSKQGYATLEEGGFEDEVMEQLTGRAVSSWLLDKANQEEMLDLIARGASRWQPMTAGTKSRLPKTSKVVANHVYVVVDATDDEVFVINPWEGHKELTLSREVFFDTFEQLSISSVRGD